MQFEKMITEGSNTASAEIDAYRRWKCAGLSTMKIKPYRRR
ncbi:hypothetical protein ACNKHU_14795 [Shigella flexneri]